MIFGTTFLESVILLRSMLFFTQAEHKYRNDDDDDDGLQE